MIKKIEWDSNFFELQIGEKIIENHNIIDLEIDGFDLLYIKSQNEIDLEFTNYKNTFSDQIIIFQRDCSEIKQTVQSQNIVPFSKTNFAISELYNLGYESGKFSRFKMDKNFDNQKFQKLYRLWIDNSLNGLMADELMVYCQNDKLTGFLSYKTNQNIATYCLFAVLPEYRGKGIGKLLLENVAQKLSKQGVKKILIPTQKSNEIACNLYKNLGFEVSEIKFIKHYWKK